MALTPLQRDQIIAAAIKDAKAGLPSPLDRAKSDREAKAKQRADRAGIVEGSTTAAEVTPSE